MTALSYEMKLRRVKQLLASAVYVAIEALRQPLYPLAVGFAQGDRLCDINRHLVHLRRYHALVLNERV